MRRSRRWLDEAGDDKSLARLSAVHPLEFITDVEVALLIVLARISLAGAM